MRVHNPLDKILNNAVKIRILRFLCKAEAEWSGRQIAQEVKASPAATHKVLHELSAEKVLLLRSVGRTHLYSLNDKNYTISELLKPLYKKEVQIPNIIAKLIYSSIPTSIINKIVSVLLFGSIKIKEERPASDIDILVLLKNAKDRVSVEKAFEKINEEIMDKFGNPVSPYLQTVTEFKSKHKKGLPITRNIVAESKLIYGQPLGELL